MELHKAIRNVVDTDGKEIVNDVRLVNILSDFRAFDFIPASKYILRAIIVDGYTQKLLHIGAWNEQCEKLCSQFVATTGFQSDYAYMVFQSLAYGLGWLNQLSQTVPNSLQKQQPLPAQATPSPTVRLTNKEQREAFLVSKLEFMNDLKQEVGVEIVNYCFEMLDENDVKCFFFNFEVRGKVKNDDRDIYIAFYDKNNKIRLRANLWYVFNDGSFRGLSIESVYLELPMSIKDLEHIYIFLQ